MAIYRATIPSPAHLQQPKFSKRKNDAKSALRFTLLCWNTLEIAIITPDLKILGENMTQTPVTFMGLHQNQDFTFSGLTTRFTDFFFPVSHSQGRNCLLLNGLILAYFQRMIINSISSTPLKTKQHFRRTNSIQTMQLVRKVKLFFCTSSWGN